MDPRKPVLEALVATLGREETTLAQLLHLADRMRDALIGSDFALLDETVHSMSEAGDNLDGLERDRECVVAGLAEGALSFDAAIALADAVGVPALRDRRSRIAALALDLQQAQERNAQLVLGAVRLRERWVNILAGMVAPTYGARGRQNVAASRRLVSKSA